MRSSPCLGKRSKTKIKTQIKMWMIVKVEYWSFRTWFNLHYVPLIQLPRRYKWFYLLLNIFKLPLAVMAVTVLMGSLISCSHVYVMRMTIKFWMELPSQKQVSTLKNNHTVTVNEKEKPWWKFYSGAVEIPEETIILVICILYMLYSFR